MGTKTIALTLSAVLFSNILSASESVSMNDMAKAVELLIVNGKKQKDQLDENIKHGNLSDTEIKKLSEKIKELQIKNIALEKQIEEIKSETQKNSKQIHENKQSLKMPNKAVQVEQVDEKIILKSKKHKFVVTSFALNIRKRPSANSAIVDVLRQGDTVFPESEVEKDGFAKTENGWIFKKYLKEIGDIK